MKNLIQTVIVSIATVLIALYLIPPPYSADTPQHDSSEGIFDRVMRTGQIRCGYVLYEPAVIKDPNSGELSGFAVDIIETIGKNSSLGITWEEEVAPGTMLEGLQSGRYDMVCTPFWRNAERARVADFSDGFYYSKMGIWVRADDNRFDDGDISKLNSADYSLSVMDGTTIMEVAEHRFPNAQTVSLPDMAPVSDLMLNVATDKADAVPIDNYLAEDFLAKNPGSVKEITAKPIRVYPNGFIIPRDSYPFKAMIDAALNELIYSGYVDRTISKYEKYPGTFYRVRRPYIELESLNDN